MTSPTHSKAFIFLARYSTYVWDNNLFPLVFRCNPLSGEIYAFHYRFKGGYKEKVYCFDYFAEIVGLGFNFADKPTKNENKNQFVLSFFNKKQPMIKRSRRLLPMATFE